VRRRIATVEKFEEFMRNLPLPVRLFVAVITVFGGMMFVTHGSDEVSGSSARVQSSASAPSKADGLIVLTHAWGADRAGNRLITGTVANRTTHRYGAAKIDVRLYGPDGGHVGSTSAKIDNLEPGATSTFEAVVKDEAVVSYKIVGVSAF
jgi:hypothetical protein